VEDFLRIDENFDTSVMYMYNHIYFIIP